MSETDAVQRRWMRRYADRRFYYPAMFSPGFRVGDLPPGSMVYKRLALAIAIQQAIHALRNGVRPLVRWIERAAKLREDPA